jgi:pimeloyl-ACP methyl ester carboxylesterase
MGDSREWRRQLESLTVVAWDAPGCGRSSDPPESFRLPDYADCLAGLAAELGVERAHVAGLSFGGGLALELYRRHPALPLTLTLASAYAGWAGSLPPDVVQRRLDLALRQADEPPEELARIWVPDLLTTTAPRELAAELAEIISAARPAGMRAMARAFAEADLRDVLPRIDIPTLLVYGERDVRSPPDVARALHAAIPGSRLVVLDGVGHQVAMEAADRFDAALRSFLRDPS